MNATIEEKEIVYEVGVWTVKDWSWLGSVQIGNGEEVEHCSFHSCVGGWNRTVKFGIGNLHKKFKFDLD